jgi:hypothetical protein
VSKAKFIVALIVLLLVTGVGSVVVRGLCDSTVTTKVKAVEVHLSLLAKAISDSYDRHGYLPNEEKWLDSLLEDNLIKRLPNDPWSEPYVYKLNSDMSFTLLSTGSLVLGSNAVSIVFVKSDAGFIERSLESNDT